MEGDNPVIVTKKKRKKTDLDGAQNPFKNEN